MAFLPMIHNREIGLMRITIPAHLDLNQRVFESMALILLKIAPELTPFLNPSIEASIAIL